MAARTRKGSRPASSKTGAGAPTLLDDDVAEKLCELLRVGAYIDIACAQVGLDKHRVREWCKLGNRESQRRRRYEKLIEEEKEDDKTRRQKIRREEAERRKRRQDEHEATMNRYEPHVRFAALVEKASAEAEHLSLSAIASIAHGGAVVHRVTMTDENGNVEVHEKLAAPNWNAAAWFLERRAPERWGKRDVVANVSIDGDRDRDEKLATARDRLTQALLRVGGDVENGDNDDG